MAIPPFPLMSSAAMRSLPLVVPHLVMVMLLAACVHQRSTVRYDLDLSYDSHLTTGTVTYDAGRLVVFGQTMALPPGKRVKIIVDETDAGRQAKAWVDGKLVFEYMGQPAR